MTKRRVFTPEFKTNVVLAVLSGQRNLTDLAREHQLKPQQISEWKAEFLTKAVLVFQRGTDREADQAHIAELERLVGHLTLELEAAKKAWRLLNSAPPKNGPSL